MFGRRPQPNVFQMYIVAKPEVSLAHGSISITVGLTLANRGPGIAEQAFITLATQSTPGPACSVELSRPDLTIWFGNFALGHQMNLILRDGLRIPPGAALNAFTVTFRFAAPIERPLRIKGGCGAAGSPTYPIDIESSAAEINDALHHALRRVRAGDDPEQVGREFEDKVLKNPADSEPGG